MASSPGLQASIRVMSRGDEVLHRSRRAFSEGEIIGHGKVHHDISSEDSLQYLRAPPSGSRGASGQEALSHDVLIQKARVQRILTRTFGK